MGNQDASCPYLQRAVRDNLLFQTPGINATLVVFDCTSNGPNPIYRKEYLDGKNNRIPISIISLSSNQRTNGRRNNRKRRHRNNSSRRENNGALPLPNDHHPVINTTTTTTVTDATVVEDENEIMVPDMGLVPRGVNTVDLSFKEINNIDSCQDDFMSSHRPILFSFVGNFRHPTRQRLLQYHNGIDQIIYDPYNANNAANTNKGSNNDKNKVEEPYAIQENDAYVVVDYNDDDDSTTSDGSDDAVVTSNTAAAAAAAGSNHSSSSSSGNSLLDTFSSYLRRRRRRRVSSNSSSSSNSEKGKDEDETDQHQPEYLNYSYTELLKKSKFGLVPRGKYIEEFVCSSKVSASIIRTKPFFSCLILILILLMLLLLLLLLVSNSYHCDISSAAVPAIIIHIRSLILILIDDA